LKKNKKWRNEQCQTLAYTLVLQSMSSPLSFLFWSIQIDFPSKVMLCRLNHNLFCFGLGALFRGCFENPLSKTLMLWSVEPWQISNITQKWSHINLWLLACKAFYVTSSQPLKQKTCTCCDTGSSHPLPCLTFRRYWEKVSCTMTWCL